MDALTRQEYPAMLNCLPPTVAVAKLNDRVKKITKINLEIADWLQERRKIEEAYATSLRKLSKRQFNEVWCHMGIFEKPWNQLMTATKDIAKSHNYFANCIEKDVELPLRNFATTNEEMSNVTTMRGNLSSMARELEDAQSRNDRLIKKGGKASTTRVEAASNRLQAAKQQWDVQAAFVFESLQALDERRVNNLRDLLTQYQTHEADHIQLNRETVESTLKLLLEISTEAEIRNWSQTDGVTKNTFKRNGLPRAGTSIVTESNPSLDHDDNFSDRTPPSKAESGEIKRLQRMGTLLTRRRKSVRSVFRSASPSVKKNGFQPFGRDGYNRKKNGLQSPTRLPTSYAAESDSRFFPLPESPLSPGSNNDIEGKNPEANLSVGLPPRISSLTSPSNESLPKTTGTANGESSSEIPPISTTADSQVDEGYSVPPAANDSISRAMEEASQDSQPQFKLSIREDPIPEQELDAEAALSSVTNTLRSSQIPPPIRKTGTFRGRRDVRNTMSIPTGDSLSPTPEHALPMTPVISSPTTTASVKVPASSKNPSIEKIPSLPLDNASIRSEKSWKINAPARHPEMNNPGLNCSIIETVSCSFDGEIPVSTSLNGEIAFTYNIGKDINIEQSTDLGHETIKIYDISNLEMILPNRSLTQPVSLECKDKFLINLSLISSKVLKGFTYRIHSPDISKTHLPLLIKSAWKNQANKLGLVLEYSLNPAFSSTQVSFTNLILIAHYTNISASSCQTKPSGTHIKDKNLVYWRLGDVTLDGAWHKTVARFSGTESMIPEPGYIEAKWELNASEEPQLSHTSQNLISGGVVIKRLLKDAHSNASDPFADVPSEAIKSSVNTAETNGVEKQNWKDISTSRKLVSGKYVTK